MTRPEAEDELRYQALLALPLASSGAVSDLMSALRDDSWRVRKVAVDRLTGELPAAQTVPRLIDALSDEDSASLRNSALEALVRIGPDAVEALREALSSSQGSDVRKFVLDALGDIRSEVVLPDITAALADSDPNVRSAAVEALGKLGGEGASDALLRIVIGGPTELQLAALDALGRSRGPVIPFPALEAHLRDHYRRRVAVRAMGRSAGAEAQRAILEFTLDPTRGTREAAFAALATLGAASEADWSGAIAPLADSRRDELAKAALDLLVSDDFQAASGAAALLGWLERSEAAVPLLVSAEREELRPGLKSAFVALGPLVLPRVEAAFATLSAGSRAFALECLAAMDVVLASSAATVREEFRGQARRLALTSLAGAEDELRAAAIELAGAVGDVAVARSLLDVSEEGEVAESTLPALAEIAVRAPEAVRALCHERLKLDGAPSAILLRLLGRVGTADDLPILRNALRGGGPEERGAAAESLATQRFADCTNLLLMALTDEDPVVRAFAARGLAGVRSAESVAALSAALNDPDELVATAAIEGLGASAAVGSAGLLTAVFGRSVSKRPLVAHAALGALGAIGDVALPVLEVAGFGPDPELAKLALRIASKQGQSAMVERLAAHPRWDVRAEAAAVVGRQGGVAAEVLLRRMLERERDPLAAKAIAGALAGLVDARIT